MNPKLKKLQTTVAALAPALISAGYAAEATEAVNRVTVCQWPGCGRSAVAASGTIARGGRIAVKGMPEAWLLCRVHLTKSYYAGDLAYRGKQRWFEDNLVAMRPRDIRRRSNRLTRRLHGPVEHEQAVDRKLDRSDFQTYMAERLTYRELFIVNERYSGLATYDALGRALSVSKERVRQIEMKAIQKLKYSKLKGVYLALRPSGACASGEA